MRATEREVIRPACSLPYAAFREDVGNKWFIEVFCNHVATTVEPERLTLWGITKKLIFSSTAPGMEVGAGGAFARRFNLPDTTYSHLPLRSPPNASSEVALLSVLEKFHAGSWRLSMTRIAAISSRVSDVRTFAKSADQCTGPPSRASAKGVRALIPAARPAVNG